MLLKSELLTISVHDNELRDVVSVECDHRSWIHRTRPVGVQVLVATDSERE